jgi:hypothetical protein
MEIVRLENPPLSFNPKIVFIEKQDNDWHFKIYADGNEIGLVIYRNDYAVLPNEGVKFTEEDKDYFINATSLYLNKTPQEASNIFHSIMKASVKPKPTHKKDQPKTKPKPKK